MTHVCACAGEPGVPPPIHTSHPRATVATHQPLLVSAMINVNLAGMSWLVQKGIVEVLCT